MGIDCNPKSVSAGGYGRWNWTELDDQPQAADDDLVAAGQPGVPPQHEAGRQQVAAGALDAACHPLIDANAHLNAVLHNIMAAEVERARAACAR